jgi:hypothetical protein
MNKARLKARTLVFLAFLVFALPYALHAQDHDQDLDENSKINTNLGFALSAPLNPLAQNTNFGWGFEVGAGYNFSSRHAIVGEFLWNRLQPTQEVLTPIRVALNTANVNGHGNLYAWTANYRYELRGRSLGAYVIAGGGFYYRNAHLSKSVTTGVSASCTPAWLWWGFVCSSGQVSSDQTLASSASGAFGVNGGMGFTVKVDEPRYRFYVEARYHYAPNSRVNTQLIPISIGIRF